MEVKRKSEVENVFLVDDSFWSMSAEQQSEILNYIVDESKMQEEISPFIEFKIGDREYTYYPKEEKLLMKLEKDKENKRYMHILISNDEQVAKMNVIANFNYTINKKYDPTPSIKREYNKDNKPMYVIDNIAELSRESVVRRAKENPHISYTKGVSIISKNGQIYSSSLDKMIITSYDKLENNNGTLLDESTDLKRVYKKPYETDLSKSLEKEVLENIGIDEKLITKTKGKNEAYSNLYEELVRELVRTRIIYRDINPKELVMKTNNKNFT